MNEPVKSQSSKPTIINYEKKTSDRRWELSYGFKDKFYLTENEKNEFLKQIIEGKDVVIINGMVLTRFFKYIVRTLTDYEKMSEGNIYLNEIHDETN